MYLAILVFIVGLFSFIVIQTQNSQFVRFDRVKNFVERRDAPPPGPFLTDEQQAKVDSVIEEIKEENLKNILILDTALLFMAMFLSYYLSGRTLEPILKTLSKQKRFISDASHELRTPLTNIRTEAEVLNRDKSSSLVEYKEFTSNTIHDIDKLNELVTYLLDAARFEDKKIEVNKTEIDLLPFLQELVKKFESRLKTKNLKLQVSSYKLQENQKILTDKNLFERLLTIIIDNAIKYNKENGEVIISAKSLLDKKVLIKIKDTGIGIKPEDLPKIFDRFYRASEDRNEKGFGLGLSIAQSLATELDIDVEVDSTFGEGTEFQLTISNAVIR